MTAEHGPANGNIAASSMAVGAGAAPYRPNLVVILADDLGWADLAAERPARAEELETELLATLKAEGARFPVRVEQK